MRRGRIRFAALAALALAVPPAALTSRTAEARDAVQLPLAAGPQSLRTNGRVNIRAEPSRSAPVVGTVAPGTLLESPGIVTGQPWVPVSRDGRLFGYVFAELVSPVAPVPKAVEVPATDSAIDPAGGPAAEKMAAPPPALGAIDDRLRVVEEALSGMRTDLDRQAQLSREGFERTGRMLSNIQARLPEPEEPAVVRLHPPPTRLDVAIQSVRGLVARLIGD
ncbi:MAG TPA: SH3 domain-containing protein [Skermanella sp.]|jgi:Bacterial SH3 domain|nr:SH3 domain-containing protein [Skermanella sp.]